jgi:hypothetical protein
MGKAIEHSHPEGVLPPDMPNPTKRNLKYALLAAVPVVVVLGSVWKRKDSPAKPEAKKPESGAIDSQSS